MNARDVSGMTPLRLAAKEGQQKVSYNLQRKIFQIQLHVDFSAC